MLHRHNGAILLRLFSARAYVGHENHIAAPDQGGRREVGDIATQFALLQGLDHGVLVDDFLAGKVQQAAPGLHGTQQFGVDQAAGRFQHGQMQADVIAASEQGGEVFGLAHLAGETPGGVHRQGRVVADDFHTHGQGHFGHHGSYRSQAHYPQGLAYQLPALELLLVGFENAVEFGLVLHVGQGVDVANALDDAPRAEQQRGGHQFLDGVGIGSRRIEYRNPPACALRHGNVVHAGACPRDGQHRVGDVLRLQLVAAQQDGVGTGELAGDLVAIARQALQALDGDLVECQYLRSHAYLDKLSVLPNDDVGAGAQAALVLGVQ